MNNGKICVSISAGTADEMLVKIERAREFADVVELRFDALAANEIDKLRSQISNLRSDIPFIATYRPPDQGGRNAATPAQRNAFWNSITETFWAVDLEEDIFAEVSIDSKRILSYHDLESTSDDLDPVYQRLAALGADTVKIAVTAGDASDAIPVWKLLERSSGGLVPIAMGEPGKWTRILGLAHGAEMTYASFNEGGETAPGQITVRDLAEVYRVRELDKNTKVYGVIGDPVSESQSPYMHNAAFTETKMNAVFIPLLVKNLDAFMRRMVQRETREVELNFSGFAVTMPHKQAIMQYLDVIDPAARQIGAVNTVEIDGGKLTGFNTDAEGFITSLKKRFPDLADARVAVLGAGGAARACIYALNQEGADVSVAARDEEKLKALVGQIDVSSLQISDFRSEISNYLQGVDVLVNATPMGMKGRYENETPVTAGGLKGVKLVYDLVVRKCDTPLVREAKIAGVPAIGGLEMLIAQGAKQFEIWTGEKAPTTKMLQAIRDK